MVCCFCSPPPHPTLCLSNPSVTFWVVISQEALLPLLPAAAAFLDRSLGSSPCWKECLCLIQCSHESQGPHSAPASPSHPTRFWLKWYRSFGTLGTEVCSPKRLPESLSLELGPEPFGSHPTVLGPPSSPQFPGLLQSKAPHFPQHSFIRHIQKQLGDWAIVPPRSPTCQDPLTPS